MVLIIDNFDSFTYNLVQYFRQLDETVAVKRNNDINLPEVEEMNPDIIVVSPGPCTPKETGICPDIIKVFGGRIPLLGICLGHQTIGSVFGARIIKAKQPVHGKVCPVFHTGKGVFEGLKSPLNVTRYHSLAIGDDNLPDCLEVTARTGDGEIMGILHRDYLIEGVQFHPEALLTEHGLDMLRSFLLRASAGKGENRK